MGIFSRRKEPQQPLSPSGQELISASEDERLAQFTFTAVRRAEEGVHPVDRDSYLEAGWAYQLGLPESAPLIAWGEVLVEWPPKGDRMVQAKAVVSTEWTVLWWQTRNRIDGVVANLHFTTSLSQRGGPMFDIEFMDAMALDATGQRMIGPFPLVVCVAPTKDGQAVRRSMEVVYTLVGQAISASDLRSAREG